MKSWHQKWSFRAGVIFISAIVIGLLLFAPDDKPKPKSSASATHNRKRTKPMPAPSRHRPIIQVVGFCASGRGSVFLHGEGFTPNGKYVTMAWGPDHEPYTRLHNPGVASAKGTTPDWEWQCETVDKPGKYGLRLFDLESQTFSNATGFEIYKP